jgi:hypothetical protein
MSDGGKGSRQRPVDPKAFSEGYDRIFGKKPSQPDGKGRRLLDEFLHGKPAKKKERKEKK